MIAFLSLLAVVAAAAPAPKGYVVRADSATVWLDLTQADGAAPGRSFEIYKEGPVLKHPITGEVLGRAEEEIARGLLTEVDANYSVGEIGSSRAPVAAGQRARLTAAAPAAPAPTAATAATGPAKREPKTRGATLPFEANAMAVGDFDGVGGPQIALASENKIMLYAYPAADAKPLAEAVVPGTGLRILGLSAGRLDGDKSQDSLFVSVYDAAFNRFETRVYKMMTGSWLKVADLPFLTRAYDAPDGTRTLATQQIVDDSTFPFGSIYPLVYRDGRYAQGRPALRPARVDWLFGFATARLGGADASIFLTPTHGLRVQLGRRHWRTPDGDYGQTPIRVRWKGRLLEFNPPLAPVSGPSGLEALYAVRNEAALGGLASPFGLFNRAELVRKSWDGLALTTDWTADLPGCAQGLAVVENGGRREIAVVVRGAAGQSSVWTFDP